MLNTHTHTLFFKYFWGFLIIFDESFLSVFLFLWGFGFDLVFKSVYAFFFNAGNLYGFSDSFYNFIFISIVIINYYFLRINMCSIWFFSSLFCLFLYRKRFCDDETNLCVLFGFKPFFFSFLFFLFTPSHLIPPKVNIQSNKIRSCLYYFFFKCIFFKNYIYEI